jgi:hypothetical protein
MTKLTNFTYANLFKNNNSFLVIDAASQCRFAASTKRKAENFLTRLLKESGKN